MLGKAGISSTRHLRVCTSHTLQLTAVPARHEMKQRRALGRLATIADHLALTGVAVELRVTDGAKDIITWAAPGELLRGIACNIAIGREAMKGTTRHHILSAMGVVIANIVIFSLK